MQLFVTLSLHFSSHVWMESRMVLLKSGLRFALCATVAVSLFVFPGLSQSVLHASDTARVPVLVELFTSEGCSDCPPADRLLEELDAKQFVTGAQAIVLSEHVTYWNHLGWRDPFSLDQMDERQKEYGSRFNLDSIYTPQMVVDGAAQMVGSNSADVTRAVTHAAATQKKALAIADAHWENGAAVFTVHGAAGSGAALVGALVADATRSEVARGENAGRTLHHVAVVRVMKEFGSSVSDGKPLRLAGGGLKNADSGSGPARLVVFLVDRKTGHVSGVAQRTVSQ
jgi:hypothetical protein